MYLHVRDTSLKVRYKPSPIVFLSYILPSRILPHIPFYSGLDRILLAYIFFLPLQVHAQSRGLLQLHPVVPGPASRAHLLLQRLHSVCRRPQLSYWAAHHRSKGELYSINRRRLQARVSMLKGGRVRVYNFNTSIMINEMINEMVWLNLWLIIIYKRYHRCNDL